MAIITISRIKHRRGLIDNDPMPQLASAEFGWGIDKRELYIGNGALEEGAPVEGNTRILTEFTNITDYLQNYIYSGPFDGAVMDTRPLSGPGSTSPIERSVISRLNDYVSIRAFGGVGDGTVDDTEAIEQALMQLYANQPSDEQYWQILYFPAGTYRISHPIQLPNHAKLIGDGMNSTIIKMYSSDEAVFYITPHEYDSVTYTPEDIQISKLTITATNVVSNVVIIGDATDITFSEVNLTAANTDLQIYNQHTGAVKFLNESMSSKQLLFEKCIFSTATYGIVFGLGGADPIETRQDIHDLIIIDSKFENLYRGIDIGHNAPVGSMVPQGIRIIGNTFDNITKEGIYIYIGMRITSSCNYFGNVGNLQDGAVTTHCIVLGDYGNDNPASPAKNLSYYQSNNSIGDVFDRTDEDDKTVARIETNSLKSYVIDPDEIHYGTLHIEPGRLIMLLNGRQTPLPTGLTLDKTKYQGAIIDYQINRSSDAGGELRRTGTMKIAQDTNHHTFSEEYNELGAVGISFSSTDVGNYTSIDYWSTGSLGNAIFSYSIKHLTSIRSAATAATNILPILDNVNPVYWIAPPMIPVFYPVSSIDAPMDATFIPTVNAVNIDASTSAITPTVNAVNIDAPIPGPVPVFDSLNDAYQGIVNIIPVFDSLNDAYQGIVNIVPVFDSLNDAYQGIVNIVPVFDSLNDAYQGIVDGS